MPKYGAVDHSSSTQLSTQTCIAAAVSASLAADARSPLLDAAELLVAGCIRAARLFPEWAEAVDQAGSADIDAIARHLVASFDVSAD